MKLNEGKSRFNELQIAGRILYEKLVAMFEEMKTIEEQVKAVEGEDFDFLPLVFGEGMTIYPEDENKEIKP